MTLDELIKYCKDVAETNNRIAEHYKKFRPHEDGWSFWEKEAKTSYEIADWLKVLKDIQNTGSCNECKSRGMCEYEPEAGQMTRYNCPFYKEEKVHEMTYGEIYDEFCKKCPDAEVSDYRPAMPLYLPRLVKPIPYAIVVWLKDGSSMIYIAESEE